MEGARGRDALVKHFLIKSKSIARRPMHACAIRGRRTCGEEEEEEARRGRAGVASVSGASFFGGRFDTRRGISLPDTKERIC